jgi:uncharacterized membrane protein
MLWIILLGVATGMRTFTAMAVLCWFMWFARLPVTGLNAWTASVVSVVVFTALALGEYYGDTQPGTGSRKGPLGLSFRLVFGAGVGALVASSFMEPVAGGVLLGIVGALIGTYGGYSARMYLAGRVGDDFPVAVGESAVAVVLSVVAMWFVCVDIVGQAQEVMLRVLGVFS